MNIHRIDYIKSKINRKLGLLKRIKNYLQIPCRILFFISYTLPLMFDYADLVWGIRVIKESLMSDLQVLQNKAARIINFSLDLPNIDHLQELP